MSFYLPIELNHNIVNTVFPYKNFETEKKKKE